MITAPRFEGDNNEAIMKKQQNEYFIMLWDLFNQSRREYLYYDWYRMMDPNLSKMISDVGVFELRVLQMSHDLIAASYRYLYFFKDESNPYPKIIDGKVYNFQSWEDNYQWENGNLAKNRKFQIPILITVAYQNTDKGNEAKNELNRQLFERYPYLDRPDNL